MKSKETIRNQILSYTNQIWGTRKIERLDLLVQMMVGTLANELYLVQNKLNDIDTTLLEKIARKLTPEKYMSVRPAHTILHMTPNHPVVLLEQNNTFTLEWVPDGFVDEKADAIIFHPVANTCLYNIKIDNIFHYKQLYAVDSNLKKQLIVNAEKQPVSNSLWLGLDINQEVENLKGLSFYIDFPKLSEIHELYDVLPFTKCFINGKEIGLKQGFPAQEEPSMEFDLDILHFYNDHYLRIDEKVEVNNLKQELVPEELKDIINLEQVSDLKPKYWVKLQFLSYFTVDILQNIVIAVNTFPVSNKKLMKTNIIRENLSKMTMLSSELGEKLLSIDSITDNRDRSFTLDVITGNNDPGTYHLESVNKVFIEEFGLTDYIEHLLDMMDDERTVFSAIDKDKVTQVMSTLANTGNEDAQKTDINNRNTGEEITQLLISPYKNTSMVNVSYWVTYGKHLNNIPSGKIFTSDKTAKIDGLIAQSLCEVYGAKEFTDIQDIMSIDRYLFTSKDRIITEHNIKCFCESELGRAIEKVEISLGGKISPKPKEGIIRVVNITLYPSAGYPDLLCRKGTLKSLKVRLQERSPDDFIYNINIGEQSPLVFPH
ncbi:type VI secretion system baseplate subunit TssF [Dysgonomonas sp. 511]|uniref:type VI secretion system baseplate subunit TssF n=1 Tax=Dysgonomonas sp. 511 TaxID=2302930 RepID=UPI0013D0C6CF|nr:type VI secretion system baseplate subunit TssF [Dysgonomonas sp. 511]NDV78475.1 hypothetical protein [Dysgonomonas sp. 511]